MPIATGPSTSFFGFDLAYDKINNVLIGNAQYDTARFDGNIAGMSWKGANDKKLRKYNYSYDTNNRLLKATFGQYPSAGLTNGTVNYTVDNVKYDANGNIIAMNQYGLKSNGHSAIIDQLSYHYVSNSNKLLNVIDIANDPTSDLGDFKYPTATKSQNTIDYTYDGNGNLTSDKNKKITNITYNILNLPRVLTVETNKGTIKYYYDTLGNKLRKRTIDNRITPSFTTVTTYIGGAVYHNDTLQFFGTTEGRVRANEAKTAWI